MRKFLASVWDAAAFRQSRPVLMTTFTNRVGSIGLSLVPILLVKKGVTTGEGAFVLSTLKATILVGTLAGGALSDRFPSRTLVLCAFLMSACGLGLLPFQHAVLMILFFGILAQLAEAMLNVAQRTLLMGQVEVVYQKEALGWLRMAHNFAQIFSYGIAAAASSFGVMPLMVFDSATSIAAFLMGRKFLPRDAPEAAGRRFGGGEGSPSSRTAFFGLAAVLLGWMFFYELFLEGGSGRLEVLHPGEGLRRFSSMMILNTILCAAFSVRASRFFERSWAAIAGGVVLTAAGILVAVWGMASQLWVFSGMVLITSGELMLAAVAQYTLMRLTPGHKNAGFYYSMGLMLMQCGRILGATLAFPLLIHAQSLVGFTSLICGVLVVLLAILYSLKAQISQLG